MPNTIKYSTTGDTLSLRKGNWYIGVGDTPKGPTSTTGHWNGISPSSGGYTIYENKVSNGPSIRVPDNDSTLINYTNNFYGGSNINTVYSAITYLNSNTTTMVVNIDYENIVTSGLTMLLDAGFIPSYPKSGLTWSDLSYNGNNGTLTNGPTYSSNSGGTIVFDGTNDYVNGPSISAQLTGDITVEAWIYITSGPSDWVRIIGTGNNPSGNRTFGLWYDVNRTLLWQRYGTNNVGLQPVNVLSYNTWYHVAATSLGSSHTLYLNGSSIGTSTVTGPWPASNETITIGSAVGIHTYLTGNISISRIYTRGLSASEILQNYNAQKSRYVAAFDSDAQAFITAASITNETQKNAVNQLVLNLKSYSLWDKMKVIYPFVGGTATSHKYNLKDPRDLNVAYRLQFNGGWTHNSNGIQGDGNTAYADTFAATDTTAIPNRANHWSSYNRTINTNSLGGYTGVYDYPPNFKFFGFYSYTDSDGFLGLQSFTGGPTSRTGLINGTVTSGSNAVIYLNGTAAQTYGGGTSFSNSFNYYLGAIYTEGSPANHGDSVISFTSLGDSLTSTNAANLYTTVQAFQTTLGRQV